MFIKHHILVIVFFLLAFGAGATHNRAGEITYKRIEPFTKVIGGITVQVFTYSITVTLYTDFGDQKADRCQDTLYFGDGDKAIIDRINGNGPMAGCRCQPHCGEIIINDPSYGVKKNVYVAIHTYPGAGIYMIRTFDRNRNKDVLNINGSIDLPFYVEAYLVITSFTGANSSPVFNFPPIDKACAMKCFYHNPGAYDPDKDDSLSYEITASRGSGGLPVLGYLLPNQVSGNENGSFGIDARTGLVSWCSPNVLGEYNIAFIVKEWRKNTSGIYQLIGYVLRDMQVIVGPCPNNDPPNIILPVDTCVEAGTTIDKQIIVSDPNKDQVVTIQGGGGAFNADSPIASLSPTSSVIDSLKNYSFKAHFVWQTNCNHVRNLPYLTTFKALDNGQPNKLANFKTYSIKVYPPSIKGVSAEPSGTKIKIIWQPSFCSPVNNPLIGYKIYRKNDCSPYIPIPCKTGLYDASAYTLVGQTSASVTNIFDDNNGKGLVVGQDYGYIVFGVYADGTETYGSSQICARLRRDIPVMINVDVLSTSVNTGSIFVRWCKPLTTKANFDTLFYPGPYQFFLKHKNSSGTYDVIFSTKKNNFYQLDTEYVHTLINTNDVGHEYYVDFIAGTVTIGSSQKANSIFVNLDPSDRKVRLSWETNTPWTNTLYTVYRKDPGAVSFYTIATTKVPTYLDTKNVANRNTYCYKVESKGYYSDTLLPKPLVNHSQERCAYVKDFTPPCSPTLAIEADCPIGYVNVKWNYLTNLCDSSDDVVKYVLYYKSTIFDEYAKLATLTNTSATNFEIKGLTYISGCYAMIAIDSSNNASKLSPDFCVDNCPEFELPNIFTPNGDDRNDNYQAIKVRQIEKINLNIFDRWGNHIYSTEDPYFKWDGTSNISKRQVSEGTFFYICDVYEPRVTGIVKRTLKGFLQLSK